MCLENQVPRQAKSVVNIRLVELESISEFISLVLTILKTKDSQNPEFRDLLHHQRDAIVDLIASNEVSELTEELTIALTTCDGLLHTDHPLLAERWFNWVYGDLNVKGIVTELAFSKNHLNIFSETIIHVRTK